MGRTFDRLDFRIVRPRSTHTRAATCEEVGCTAYARGWVSVIDEATELGQQQAGYIRHQSGRAFTEARDPAGLTRFTFRAEQRCFAEHRADLEREPGFLRLSTHGTARRHTAETWQDECATELDRLQTFVERHG
jgi:hypothetical protein